MKPIFLLPTFLLWLPVVGLGMEPTALTNAVLTILPEVLGAEDGCHELMGCAVTANKWTPDDCSAILLCAQSLLKGSDDRVDAYRRENAIVLLSEFGSTNALDGLSELITTESGMVRELAGNSFLLLTRAAPSKMPVLKAAMNKSSSGPTDFTPSLYRRIDNYLIYPDGDSSFQRNLLHLVLERVAEDISSGPYLDEILCREVPKWRASPQRLANAERMIREHSNDTGAVSFFEGVRADALSAGASAREQNPDGRFSGTPADSSNQGDDSKDAADPWADLLDDLPEKQPWVPPDGMVPAS